GGAQRSRTPWCWCVPVVGVVPPAHRSCERHCEGHHALCGPKHPTQSRHFGLRVGGRATGPAEMPLYGLGKHHPKGRCPRPSFSRRGTCDTLVRKQRVVSPESSRHYRAGVSSTSRPISPDIMSPRSRCCDARRYAAARRFARYYTLRRYSAGSGSRTAVRTPLALVQTLVHTSPDFCCGAADEPTRTLTACASEPFSQRSKEISHVLCQSSRLLHGREMPTLLHLSPMANIGVVLLGNRARRTADLAGESGVPSWYIDGLASGDGPGPMETIVVRPKRRSDGTGEPIEGDVGQQVIARHYRLEVATVVRPDVELLSDPCRKADWRVRQRIGERLGSRALNLNVTGLFLRPPLYL